MKAAFALLVIVIIAVAETALSEQTPSAKLIITLDGSDTEWTNLAGWICPANYPQGEGCFVPSTDYTAWLCCNTTSTPRECQLMWRDGLGDVNGTADARWIRLYMNATGVYTYTNVLYKENRYTWLVLQIVNATDFKLNIVTYFFITRILNIPVVYTTAWYSLYNPAGLLIRWGMITRIDYMLDTVNKVFALEIAMPFVNVPGFSTSAGTLRVSVTLSEDPFTVNTSSGSTGEIVVEVLNWYIASARALSDPIPVPEPSVLIALVTAATIIGLTWFTLNKQGIYEYLHRATRYQYTTPS